jgi:hypothetical protein
MAATVDIMSVINGDKIKIKKISLDEPYIHAIVLKDGKANWDITKPSIDTTKAAAQPSQFKLALNKLTISNAKIIYEDASMGVNTVLYNFNHELSGDFTQDNFVLKTLTNIEQTTVSYGGVKYLNKVKTMLKADLDMDMKNSKYTFKDNELQLNELFIGFDGFVGMATKDMDLDMKFSAKKNDFKNFISLIPAIYTKDFSTLKTSGNLAFDGFVKGKMGDKVMPAFGLNLSINNGMFQYPALPTAVNNVLVDLKVTNPDGNLDHTVVNLSKMHVELGTEPFDAKMLLKTPISDAQIDAAVKGRVNLGNINKIVPLEKGTTLSGLLEADLTANGRMSQIQQKKYEEFKAAGEVTVTNLLYSSPALPKATDISKVQLTFNPQNVTLNAFDAKIGKSDVQMTGTLDNFIAYALKGETLQGTLNMSSSLLDLNELMASDAKPATEAKKDTTPTTVMEVPANIDFVLSAKITKLLYDKLVLDNVNGKIIIKDQTVRMEQLTMNMLKGDLSVTGSYNTKNAKKPAIDFDLGINNFDIPSTFTAFNTVQKLAPIAAQTTGAFSSNFKITGELDNKMNANMQSLNSAGAMNLANIVVQNFEPLNKLAGALKMDKYKQLNLDKVAFTFKVRDGRLFIDPFNMAYGTNKVRIAGSNGLDQSIDYTMNFEIPRAEFGSAANAVLTGLWAQANAKGANFSVGDKINVDALVGGTVTKPFIKLSMADSSGKSLVDDAKAKVAEEFNKKKAELEAKAKAEIDKLKTESEAKVKEATDKAKAEADRMKKQAEDKAKTEIEKAKQDAKDKAKKGLKDLFGNPK